MGKTMEQKEERDWDTTMATEMDEKMEQKSG